jgi:hypothetical protein
METFFSLLKTEIFSIGKRQAEINILGQPYKGAQ